MDQSVKAYIAEFLGTAALVLMACGAVTIGGFGATGNILAIALSFGLAITAIIYAIENISGAHINPAVTIAVWISGTLPTGKAVGYIIAQCLGGIAGAALLAWILSGRTGGYDLATGGLGQNGWGAGMFGGYAMHAAIAAEFIGTLVFTYVILNIEGSGSGLTGVVIGMTLAAVHLTFINVTGVSVNPARSLGPALLVGGTALSQVWLFLVVPLLAGAVSGLIYKANNS